jgi:hypothetical protein
MHKALETADTVVMVDDIVTGVQIPICLVMAPAPSLASSPMCPTPPCDLALPDDGDSHRWEDKAVVNTDGENRRFDGCQFIDNGESCPGFGEETGYAFRCRAPVHGDDHIDSATGPLSDRRRHGVWISRRRPESTRLVSDVPW